MISSESVPATAVSGRPFNPSKPENIGSFPLQVSRPFNAPADFVAPATVWVNLIRFDSGMPKVQITAKAVEDIPAEGLIRLDLDRDDLARLVDLFDARDKLICKRMYQQRQPVDTDPRRGGDAD